jgi:hypothetical protein
VRGVDSSLTDFTTRARLRLNAELSAPTRTATVRMEGCMSIFDLDALEEDDAEDRICA